MLFSLTFPAIDPVAVDLGFFQIRWYALAYIVGLLLAWRYLLHLGRLPPRTLERAHADDLLVWMAFGVILGGRLGYVLFYKPSYYLDHPLEIAQLWHGGMSFHGGLLGVVVAGLWFCRQRGLSPWRVGDLISCCGPIGLLLGRLANFVNGELYGRVTDASVGMVFPNGGPLPRHPSQLYEAAMEGLLLFLILAVLVHRERIRRHSGLLIGVFLAGYGLARSVGEMFREPDAYLGFVFGHVTMGQILSLPMILVGLGIIVYAARRAPVSGS
ncbi:MAG: prolipoprotein diacylglyceryl transferase [Alphaproteobacteria bacterium]|nr:prolipoprotein diacylglyceryl transferase [Alphaproteobacteria bacterium]MCB9930404.1 prolipoprotein diacylglyceryl transferase [Alphaproteobacteria bacterium]